MVSVGGSVRLQGEEKITEVTIDQLGPLGYGVISIVNNEGI
jgi:hypothetical protein